MAAIPSNQIDCERRNPTLSGDGEAMARAEVKEMMLMVTSRLFAFRTGGRFTGDGGRSVVGGTMSNAVAIHSYSAGR